MDLFLKVLQEIIVLKIIVIYKKNRIFIYIINENISNLSILKIFLFIILKYFILLIIS